MGRKFIFFFVVVCLAINVCINLYCILFIAAIVIYNIYVKDDLSRRTFTILINKMISHTHTHKGDN